MILTFWHIPGLLYTAVAGVWESFVSVQPTMILKEITMIWLISCGMIFLL